MRRDDGKLDTREVAWITMTNAISYVFRWPRWPARFLQEGSIEIMDKLW